MYSNRPNHKKRGFDNCALLALTLAITLSCLTHPAHAQTRFPKFSNPFKKKETKEPTPTAKDTPKTTTTDSSSSSAPAGQPTTFEEASDAVAAIFKGTKESRELQEEIEKSLKEAERSLYGSASTVEQCGRQCADYLELNRQKTVQVKAAGANVTVAVLRHTLNFDTALSIEEMQKANVEKIGNLRSLTNSLSAALKSFKMSPDLERRLADFEVLETTLGNLEVAKGYMAGAEAARDESRKAIRTKNAQLKTQATANIVSIGLIVLFLEADIANLNDRINEAKFFQRAKLEASRLLRERLMKKVEENRSELESMKKFAEQAEKTIDKNHDLSKELLVLNASVQTVVQSSASAVIKAVESMDLTKKETDRINEVREKKAKAVEAKQFTEQEFEAQNS